MIKTNENKKPKDKSKTVFIVAISILVIIIIILAILLLIFATPLKDILFPKKIAEEETSEELTTMEETEEPTTTEETTEEQTTTEEIEETKETYEEELKTIELHPSDIGYIVEPTGVNTVTAIIGDSISNTKVIGFFGFDLSSLSGKTIDSVTLKLKTYKFWDDAPPSNFSDIGIAFSRYKIFPLDPGDLITASIIGKSFLYNEDPILWSDDNNLKSLIQHCVESNVNAEFHMGYHPNCDTDLDNRIDGKEYRKEDITLTVDNH
jgi:hypothetical protein